MPKFLIVIEKAGDNYSAYSPDIPGCVATGATPHEAEDRMNQAIILHIEGSMKTAFLSPNLIHLRHLSQWKGIDLYDKKYWKKWILFF